ncbi:hypothetical protein NGA_0714900, partial [Nannochloropsis gaditana CCMP526]|uniref:uncharacterized protein n=1 Tax=Nannochloropsis gaditana (strain CCMP526) TaxID=1093141 RepID=UPI00029F7386
MEDSSVLRRRQPRRRVRVSEESDGAGKGGDTNAWMGYPQRLRRAGLGDRNEEEEE